MAGLTYWFPKIFGFRLNERIGVYAFWCWLIGFLLAFIPLYILGLMGATRRLSHYDASLGWQQLFIVSGIGVMIIIAGIGLQLFQLAYSIYKRKQYIDKTGDPWNGRTLEWSTKSPAPHYNFAVIPEVSTRDAFWEAKHQKQNPSTDYKPFKMPKNTSMGIVIAGFSLIAGFALIWHIWWLAAIGLLGIVVSVIVRINDDNTEYTVTVEEIKHIEGVS